MAVNPNLTPSFRLPKSIPSDVAHPLVVQGLLSHDKSIVDLNQAIVALSGKIGTITKATTTIATTTGTTSGGGTGTTGVSTFNTQSGGVVYFPSLGMVNNQTGITSYTTVPSDSGSLIVLNDASPIAVTLATVGITTPFYTTILNFGTGAATITPATGTINGLASVTLPGDSWATIYYDGTNFWAELEPIVPVNTPAIPHEFFTAYNAATGVFTVAQPTFSDISGIASTNQIGTGTPSTGEYVDGGTGVWTALPVVSAPYHVVLASGATAAAAGEAIFCNTATGFTVTLPLSSSNSGLTIIVKKVSSDANTLTVAASGGNLIDGVSSWSTATPYASVEFISDGTTNWYIV